MRENAHVGSSDAIVAFRAALLTFQEEALAAVESIEMKAGKTLRFLDEEAPGYWGAETRTAYDNVNKARIELSICRNKTVAGRKSSCIEEKKAYAKTQDRLEFCRRQQSVTRKTSLDAHDAADEYRARITHLRRVLESDVPRLQVLLHRISVSLEAYTATRPPTSNPQPVDSAATPTEVDAADTKAEPGSSDSQVEENQSNGDDRVTP